jgi:hypothetical protein
MNGCEVLGCPAYEGGKCQDERDYRNKNAGEPTCPRNPDALPRMCPEHPHAKVLVSWDEKQYVMNGYPSGHKLRLNRKWECRECGIELAPDPSSLTNPDDYFVGDDF